MKLGHSIGQLALAVLACALSFRAVTAPSRLWAAAILSSAVATCTFALIGALRARGPRRASFAGAAACGWAYLLASLGPWAGERIAPDLPTSAAIDRIFEAIRARGPALELLQQQIALQDLVAETRKIALSSSNPRDDPRLARIEGARQEALAKLDRLRGAKARYDADAEADPEDRWAAWSLPSRRAIPGGPLRASIPFRRIGHGLFAIAFALLGAALVRPVAHLSKFNELRSTRPPFP